MQQSLRNLKATGANYVALVVPYYQSNTGSTDIAPGWNTPTDAALGSAIDFAHSIGLQVAVKVHNEVYTGDWRAYINPGDRNTWFANYNNELVHIGQVAAQHHAEMYILGTEMVSVASAQVNSDNTQRWQTIISNVRKVYSGLLSYDANSTNNNNSPFENEKASIGFWGSLDMIGLSAYYNLNTGSNDVQSLMNQWDFWNKNDLQSFAQRVGKPIFFAEIGYKSVSGAHQAPWDSGRGGGYDPTEQSNDYQALMQYWNNYSYMQGVLWWDWKVDPNGGGNGNTDYTVQNKPAQQVLTQWFTNPPGSNSGGGTTTGGGTTSGNPSFTSSATANPNQPSVGIADTITASIKNSGGTLTNAIVDIEVYDAGNKQILQKFYQGQTLQSGQTQTFTANWTPGAAGQYRVTVGIFNSDWTQAYTWNSNALNVNVGAQTSTPPPNNNPPSNNPPPTNNPPPSGNFTTNVWWPSNGATVTGVQPFKANIPGLDVSQYAMYWQVDGGQLNQMSNSATDYPHKEAGVNLSGWNWSSNHQYTLTFVSKNGAGAVISQQSVKITVQ